MDENVSAAAPAENLTPEQLIDRLTAVENAITDALEAEDYAAADELNQERDGLIKLMVATYHASDDVGQKQELQNFARALKEHGEQTVAAMQAQRDATRAELLALRHGQTGKSAYQQVRRTRG